MGKSRNIGSIDDKTHMSTHDAINMFEHLEQKKVNVLPKKADEVLKGGILGLLKSWEKAKIVGRHNNSMKKASILDKKTISILEGVQESEKDFTTTKYSQEIAKKDAHLVEVIVNSALIPYLHLMKDDINL